MDEEAYASAANDSGAVSAILSGDGVESVDEDETQPEDPTAVQPTPSEGAILAAISKERPSNKATSTNTYEYIQLTNDEYYEILLEVDSTFQAYFPPSEDRLDQGDNKKCQQRKLVEEDHREGPLHGSLEKGEWKRWQQAPAE